MSNKLKKKRKKVIDWNIHAVYNPDTSMVDMHTHGLEKHNMPNICMVCPWIDNEMIKYCGNFMNELAQSMIDGEKYRVGITHMCDNINDPNEIYDVFDLNIEERDNGEGKEKVYVVDYWFDDIYINMNNFLHYIFDKDAKKWRVFTRDEFDNMPKAEYEKKIKRNRVS